MHQAVFKKVNETPKGTYMQVFVPGVFVPDSYFVNGLANGVYQLMMDEAFQVLKEDYYMHYLLI